MIAPVENQQSNPLADSARPAVAAASEAPPNKASAVDFQNFLRLLTAQLRNQDPLSPLDSTQFVAQLASFSTVEQLVTANNRLDDIASSIVSDAMERYAPWIGREAEIKGAPAYYDGDDVRFRAPPEPAATRLEAVVRDSSGVVAARLPIIDAGAVQRWNGAGAAPGVYSIEIAYYDGDDRIASATASVFATIEGVRLSGGGAELRLSGGRSAAPDQIVELSMPQ